MIVVRLAGGLGNQIFQVMAGLLLGQRIGQRVSVLSAGLTSYPNVRAPEVTRLLSSPNLVVGASVAIAPLARWLSVTARAGRWLPIGGLNDRRFPKAIDEPLRARHINFLDGYFQRGWTAPLLRDAMAQICVADVPGAAARAAPYDCLVHIRGGDFLNLTSHGFLDANYYDHCLSLARAQGCQSFGIVTDDPAYAGHVISGLRQRHPALMIELLPSATDVLQDFATLRHARHRIIGNSTFAWWASALDVGAGPTWAPDRFVRAVPRDFFLPHERTIASSPQ
jgi:hypothetical protein